MAAARLQVPVVPVRLEGLDRILHHKWKFPQRGNAQGGVRASYVGWRGRTMRIWPAQVEEAVRSL